MPVNNYVLVVDPDRELVSAIQVLLKQEGYESIAAHDGEKALEQCKQNLPKVVLVEGLIPKLNGIDLAKKIRELPDGGLVSILLISAVFTGAKFRSQIKEAKIDDVLAKPFLPSDLISKVKAFELKVKAKPESKGGASTSSEYQHAGFLTDTPFVRMIYFIYSQKLTGTLRLQNAEAKKLVTFELGEPKFVVSNMERECLGQILVKKGRLTPEECAQSLDMMSKMNKRQGEALIQMGLIEPYELEETLKHQAREKFCEIFGWRQGQYLFVPGKVFKKELTPVDLSLEQLCLRGVKEHYSLTALQEALSNYVPSPPILTDQSVFKLDNFKFATWDMKIVQLIRRKETLGKIVESKIARELDVYHLFYTLFMLGLLQFKQDVAKTPSTESREISIPPTATSPFELLGVSANAKDSEVQKAYEVKLAKLANTPGSEFEVAAVQSAYKKIATLQGRRDYLMRAYEEKGALPPESKEFFKVSEYIEIGKKFLEKKDIPSAKKVFTDGIAAFPDEGLVYSYLGFASFLEAASSSAFGQPEVDRAKKLLIKGAQLAPEEAETHFMLGRAFALEKDYEHAAHEFQKTLELKPKHIQAASELRLANLRLEKQKNTSFIRWKK